MGDSVAIRVERLIARRAGANSQQYVYIYIFLLHDFRKTSVKLPMASRPTVRLWLQFMEMVGLLCQFVKAEHTGNWSVNVQTRHEMLRYFAAADQNLHAKSVPIYLQQILHFQRQHPDITCFLQHRNHVITPFAK